MTRASHPATTTRRRARCTIGTRITANNPTTRAQRAPARCAAGVVAPIRIRRKEIGEATTTKAGCDYNIWNRLIGIENPERLGIA